jgi:hypothetical protein
MVQRFCSNCGAALLPETSFCTRCGFGNPSASARSRSTSTPGVIRKLVLLFVLVVVAAVAVAFVAMKQFSRTRSHAPDAEVTRYVFSHAEHFGPVLDALGSPVATGCCASIRWEQGTADARIPIAGPRAKGELVAALHLDDNNGWELDRFILQPAGGASIDLLPAPVPAKAEALIPDGKIYFVPIGPQAVPVEKLAAHYKEKFGLDVTVLPPMAIPANAYVESRKQYGAEDLIDAMRKDHWDLAMDPNAHLIAITHADIFIRSQDWYFTYALRAGDRSAVVSTARMYDRFWNHHWWSGSSLNASDLQEIELRARQMITKEIAVQYWHLPMNDDPKSVLMKTLTPDDRPDDIHDSDVHPEQTIYGRDVECLSAAYDSVGIHAPALTQCTNSSEAGFGEQVVAVETGRGHLFGSATDFALPAGYPLEIMRIYTAVPGMEVSFGKHSWLNYNSSIAYNGPKDDVLLTVYGIGHDPYTFARISEARGYRGKYEGVKDRSEYFGAIGWNPGGRIEITRTNGEREAYLYCIPCYGCMLQEIRRPGWGVVKVDRDRNNSTLTRVSSDAANLVFEYDDKLRIASIQASDGTSATYSYNDAGCLATVMRGSTTTSYSYEPNCQLSDVTVSDPRGTFHLLHAEYTEDHLSSATLAGQLYRFGFVGKDKDLKCTSITLPDGRVLAVFDDVGYLRAKE